MTNYNNMYLTVRLCPFNFVCPTEKAEYACIQEP